ncbi:MAG: excinuclease ABC subunit UvrC [Candidatus Kapabacteria bacterium]|nr:excinuclease ABC subunit UvrC [Candidatus Kapabacteria bacterium]MDW8012535.1 excinuclease ABC subunit UvrC [Bacteroidota bacterium]
MSRQTASHLFAEAAATVEALPTLPGVYLFRNAAGTVIYVGKAKNLRQRVRSYFQPSRPTDAKTQALVRNIARIEYIVTDTEVEALILENTLIKRHKPRYNILLRDDKSYPFIRVTHEPYPRIFLTRRLVRDGSLYFGPYTDAKYARHLLRTLRALFPIRSCDLPLSEESIRRGKFRVCLDYHIGKCLGPCEGLISQEEYRRYIRQAVEVLRGRTRHLQRELEQQMHALAAQLRFEEAAQLRDRLRILQEHTDRQKVISSDPVEYDVLGIAVQDTIACAVFLSVREGKLIDKRHVFLHHTHAYTLPQLIQAALEQWYLEHQEVPEELLLPELPEQAELIGQWLSHKRGAPVRLVTPRAGERAQLIRMAELNARVLLDEHLLQRAKRAGRIPHPLQALQQDLRLPTLPRRIACIDNSHLHGAEPVSALVVFVDGKPHKAEYRRFRLEQAPGNDDFAAMREVVSRYARRILNGEDAAPDLLLIDGGKGQLSAAVEALTQCGLYGQFTVLALAKRLEELFRPGEPDPILLPKTSESLRLLQRIRNEAHRFAVEYHRLRRRKYTLQTELTQIPGIGPQRAQRLLNAFGSVESIRAASLEELKRVLPSRYAEAVYRYFRPESAK